MPQLNLLTPEPGEVEITIKIPRALAQRIDQIRKTHRHEYLGWYRTQSVFAQMALVWFIHWLEDEKFDPLSKIGDC